MIPEKWGRSILGIDPPPRKGREDMSKRIITLALLVVSAAMFALPAAAGATPLHISSTGAFTIKAGTGTLSTTSGTTIHCVEGTGSGSITTTTTGAVQLALGTCSAALFGVADHCQSTAQPGAVTETGIIRSTPLTTHYITANETTTKDPALLLTPSATTPTTFAHVECETAFGNINFAIEGNGLIGRIKSPACGGRSKTATIDFNATAHGVQELTSSTGVTYSVTKSGEKAALDAEATITFTDGVERTLTCT
ncbi:MAG TPA: hypothetical protein VN732_04555 [Solirubrobacterales bacterium]|nr:hypothetical protein [Solirubrobacterales bacterium]